MIAGIGVQTKNVVMDSDPAKGFAILQKAGFRCVDFSLNAYLTNTSLYQSELNNFFGQSIGELENFFTPHKQAAHDTGIAIHQMHMPYPNYVPGAKTEVNEYLWNEVAPKRDRKSVV